MFSDTTRTNCGPENAPSSRLQSAHGYTLDQTPTHRYKQPKKNKKSKHSGALRTEGRRNWTGKSKATWNDYTKSQDVPSEFLFFENN